MAETMTATEERTDAGQAAETSSGTGVQSVEFPEVEERGAAGAGTSLDILLDMEVPVTVMIGRAEIPIQQLLQLGPGAVLKLDNTIDTPAELYLKDTKFAYGDIVVVEDKFAIRIKELIGAKRSPKAGKA